MLNYTRIRLLTTTHFTFPPQLTHSTTHAVRKIQSLSFSFNCASLCVWLAQPRCDTSAKTLRHKLFPLIRVCVLWLCRLQQPRSFVRNHSARSRNHPPLFLKWREIMALSSTGLGNRSPNQTACWASLWIKNPAPGRERWVGTAFVAALAA